jgi:peptide/nickel transport system substrate-binding protein
LRYDRDWNPQPYLAQDWSISEDGLSVTLHLVEDALFHDGHPVTSADVAFSVMVVKENHPFQSMFAPVESVDTPDPHTAIIRLSQPHPAILLAMSPALLPILPEHVYGDGQDLADHPANLAPIGSGPFRLVSYDPEGPLVLERNPDHFIPDRPYLDGLVFHFESATEAIMIDLERQEAHLAVNFADPGGLDRLSQSTHLNLTREGYEAIGAINWLAFNLLREPLNDQQVRQAIAYTVDPDFITEYLLQGRSQRVLGPISPGSPFYETNVQRYDLDLAEANRLLDEAGYPRGPDGTRFSLQLDYIPVPSVQHHHRDVALYLGRQLAEIGIDVQVRELASFAEWAQYVGSWDFDMTLDTVYNWGDPVIGVHRTYQCSNIRQGVIWSNTQNYCNGRVDELLEQAAVELDEESRRSLYSEFQHIVTQELPVVWLNTVSFHTVHHVGLVNLPSSIWGMMSPLDELYWSDPPVREYSPIPSAPEDSDSSLPEIGIRALELLQQGNLYDARESLGDPNQGFLDLEGSGLHVIGFTQAGLVFLDNSGQLERGMDISGILDLEGNSILSLLLEAADNEDGGLAHSQGVWPHPTTEEIDPMTAWCARLSETDVVCVLEWAQP